MIGASRRLLTAGIAPLVVVLVLFGVGLWFLSADARREVDALATANADSSQWSLAQSEVEFLRLRTAIQEARNGDPAALAAVRARFDVFYSRIQTIKSSPTFADVRDMPKVADAILSIERFLDDVVPLVDGSDAALASSLDTIGAGTVALSEDLRTISLAGVRVFAARSEMQRERVAAALFDLALVSVLLVAVVVGFAYFLARLLRSSRVRAERLQITRSRLRAIASTSLDAILVVGRDGRIIDFNGAAENIFGYTPDEAIGQSMGELIVPEHYRSAHEAGMERYRTTGERKVIGQGRLQLEARDKAGRVFPVELSISTARSDDGEIFISFIRDISRRVAAEQELIDARDSALAGEKAKAELLAIMSHEMRTPLNGIFGTLQLLEASDLDPSQREYVDVMNTSAQMLIRHVNSVLDISRSDAGAIEVAASVFDPGDIADSVAGALNAQAAARGNRLRVSLEGIAPGPSVGDPDILRQVLINLVGNAIKFTEDGFIDLEYERLPAEDTVEFRVVDTGIGIAEADVSRIFEDFVTLDASFTRKVEGTGLGLGIVRRLVTLMKGSVGVETAPGEGSVFWVRLPLPPASDTTGVAPSQVATHPTTTEPDRVSILLVEDNEINRLVAHNMLKQAGCDVTEARDGREGVACASERRFDLILMDISMPHLDGIEATRLIRSEEGPNAGTPVIALTAHALPADLKRFHDAGMADVVVKPIDRRRLAAVLDGVRDGRRADGPDEDRTASGLMAGLDDDISHALMARAQDELSVGLARLQDLDGQPEDIRLARPDIHKLAGTAAVIGASDLRNALAAAEEASAGGDRELATRHLSVASELLRDLRGRDRRA